jgi:hypothetical protein
VPTNLVPPEDTLQKELVQAVVEDLESYLKVKAQRIDITALWGQNPPAEAGGEGLYTYLQEVCTNDCPKWIPG